MKTELTELGPLSSQITITLGPDDYKDKLEKELRKHKNKSHLKGFRKGKTPMSAIRKMYGKSILADIINSEIQNGLADYISSQELDILGNPLPSPEQKEVDFDLKELGEYQFHFDLGIAPSFEMRGASESDTYTRYVVKITDDMISEQVDNLLKRMGTQEETDEPLDKLDILTVYAVEKEGAERDVYTTEFNIMADRMTDEYLEVFLGKKKGFKHEVDVFQLEKDASEEYVRKYLIKDAPEDINRSFELEIKSVKRLVPASMTKETLDKAFGPENVKDEEAARSRIKEDLTSYYEEQALAITKRYILEGLVEANEIELPNDFLKRWLLVSNPKIDAAQVDNEYEDFTKNLRWNLIKTRLAKKYEISVGAEEIRESLLKKVQKQFAGYHYEGLDYNSLVENLMKKQETVQKEYEELLAESVLDQMLKSVHLKEKIVSVDEYKSIVESLQQNFG